MLAKKIYGDDERGKKKDKGNEFLIDVGEGDPLLTEGGVDGKKQGNPQDRTLTGWKNLPKQGPDLERENEPRYQTKNLPNDWIPPKDGGRHEEDISQQRAEGFEGGDEFGGTEEAQEPREGQVVPVEAHARREDAVGGEDEQKNCGWNCKRFLKEGADFFFHKLILPFGKGRYNCARS